MPLSKDKKTVAIDFDGVIHRYSKGWYDGTAYDDAMPGAISAIKKLMEEYTVYVFTTRDLAQVQDWFGRYGQQIPTQIIKPEEKYWTTRGVLGLANHKVIAYVWVDDRALRFTGDWADTMRQLRSILR